jgi:hypothetical protein
MSWEPVSIKTYGEHGKRIEICGVEFSGEIVRSLRIHHTWQKVETRYVLEVMHASITLDIIGRRARLWRPDGRSIAFKGIRSFRTEDYTITMDLDDLTLVDIGNGVQIMMDVL